MSNVKKCDRCGAIWNCPEPNEENDYVVDYKYDFSQNFWKGPGKLKKFIFQPLKTWKWSTGMVKDLCPECCDKLNAFLDGKELVNYEEEKKSNQM